jgi:serine phosphatase RsbU (regulator of sigma subunit)
MLDRVTEAVNLPLGVIEPTNYYQFAVHLQKGDLVLIYSDALPETQNADRQMLGDEGFLDRVRRIDATHPETFCSAVLDAVDDFRGRTPTQDDVTLVLLHHNGGRPPRQSIGQMVRVMGKMFGLLRV